MKILVANRGEIAVRIIRACREMGIRSVAVFSDCDRDARHVREAEQAVHIGASPAAQSYLRIEKIIDAARRTGADAVHPGYGFLAENAAFAAACADAGLTFIGPSAASITLMGSKTAAREAAIRAGVPVVPGNEKPFAPDASDQEILASAEAIGYPLLVKAVAGGGGKGMRTVETRQDLLGAIATARSEAGAAFGDSAVYLERRIRKPRHIEIQLLGDHHGTIIPFVERECSIQRRHQKVVEESPSIAVDPELRRRIASAAAAVARSVGYHNAGTIEFLLDEDGAFYFLEMNTRLQVEHPVTELVTSLDLVHWQIRIARGERLDIDPELALTPHGHAIECRITSEDPANGFLPSTGRVQYLHLPGGPGVRWDGGIETGSVVTLHYDPMLAKLIVWAPDRARAIERMHRALLELTIDGVDTSRDFHLRVMEDAEFQAGAIAIQWLERRLPELLGAAPPHASVVRAAVAAALLTERDRASRRPGPSTARDSGSASGSAWLQVARREALQ
jgi:acetyl-CoA carboxylase biotin carboxylase subunit